MAENDLKCHLESLSLYFSLKALWDAVFNKSIFSVLIIKST